MRYRIEVNGLHVMDVRYITDAECFICERASVGESVVVTDTQTGESRVPQAGKPLPFAPAEGE